MQWYVQQIFRDGKGAFDLGLEWRWKLIYKAITTVSYQIINCVKHERVRMSFTPPINECERIVRATRRDVCFYHMSFIICLTDQNPKFLPSISLGPSTHQFILQSTYGWQPSYDIVLERYTCLITESSNKDNVC